MDFSPAIKNLENENGIVTMVSLMVLVTLTVAGIVAVDISNNETGIVRNEQLSTTQFYDAETGINDARINFNRWLTDTFLTTAQTAANSTFNTMETDAAGNPLATIQVRCIEDNATNGSGNPAATIIFGDAANGIPALSDEIPAMPHIVSPPAGSGFSLKYFETRRYSITATSNTGNTAVQAGVWKVFNKY